MNGKCKCLIVSLLLIIMGITVANYDFIWAEENTASEQTIISNTEETIKGEMSFSISRAGNLKLPELRI